jgi:hypothetical protein
MSNSVTKIINCTSASVGVVAGLSGVSMVVDLAGVSVVVDYKNGQSDHHNSYTQFGSINKVKSKANQEIKPRQFLLFVLLVQFIILVTLFDIIKLFLCFLIALLNAHRKLRMFWAVVTII